MRFRPSFLVAALAVSVAAISFAGCGSDDGSDGDGQTIVLGSIFSTSGDGAAFGPQQVDGAELAIKEINEDGGINGADLDLKQMNDKADPGLSPQKMKQLVSDNAIAVLGPTFSNQAAVADPVANTAGMPVLAVSNTGPGIVGDCPYPCEYVFRDSLGEAAAIPANIKTIVANEGTKTASIIHPADDDFGESSAQTAAEAFKADGVKVTHISRSVEDLPAALKGKPDAIMITASSGEAATDLIRSIRNSGYKGSILGGNAFNSTTSSQIAGADGKGAQSAAAWYSGNDSDENNEFIANYKEAYQQAPDQFAAQAYTGVQLIADALEDSDLTYTDIAKDRDTLKDELAKVSEETPLGDFKFTDDHDVSQPIWVVQMNGKGGFSLVKEIPAPS